MVGILNHGQGLETSLSQVAAHELGLDPAMISIRYGDTSVTPFGFGTFASRSIVFSGGAVARASNLLEDKIRTIGAHLLQAPVDEVSIRDRRGGCRRRRCSDRGDRAGREHPPGVLPQGMAPGLETTSTYEPPDSGGVFSYGVHAAVVAVDPETGVVEILKYALAEDCGTMINPMIVDGQIIGGVPRELEPRCSRNRPMTLRGQPLRPHSATIWSRVRRRSRASTSSIS